MLEIYNMTLDLASKITRRYLKIFNGSSVKPKTIGANCNPKSDKETLEHVHYMLLEMTEMVRNYSGNNKLKFNRWLGFVQGCFFCIGIFTLNQLRNHNFGGV